MPIWFETVALMLAAYGIGLAIGWLIWGRAPDPAAPDTPEKELP
ncbi:hypothetical protein [Qipengyuania psychrotolerans]|nr:hypothetical protein [Qipengyuania psychrotolerans]